MKLNKLLVAIALLLVTLSGCSKEVKQTNKSLSIYISYKDKAFEYAADIFQKKYPDIQLDITKEKRVDSDQNYENQQKLSAQLMSGEGPDIFSIQSYWDLDKLIKAGALADLESFYSQDSFFKSDDLNHQIIDSGVIDGKRYIIPMEYTIPLLLSTEEALAETKFDVENCKDFQGFMEESQKYMDGPNYDRLLFRMDMTARDCLKWAGYPIVDINQNKVIWDTEQTKPYFEWYKKIVENGTMEYFYGDGKGAAAVRDKQCLFENSLGFSIFGDYTMQIQMLDTVATPKMVPIYNLNGGITATVSRAIGVRANSENLENAWKFIQILFSDEVQFAPASWRFDISVSSKLMEEYAYKDYSKRPSGIELSGFIKDVPDLKREDFDTFMGFTKQINSIIINPSNQGWRKILNNAMADYISGDKSYEEATQNAIKQLEIYLSE